MSAEFSNLFFVIPECLQGLVIIHFRNLISKSCLLTAKQIIHTTESVKASSLSVTHILCRSLSEAAQSKIYCKLPVHP